MDLSFSELKKREVISVSDGKSLGFLTNITLTFPSGEMVGITVPGKKLNCITKLFNRSKIYIPSYKILKIGNDVILVDLRKKKRCEEQKPPKNPCFNIESDCFSAETVGKTTETDDFYGDEL
ncbi:MAG: YlmC/YmxH family sporulation protein [Clostridia bacterium]|nr:YlmC/YmxH family sporulation protein [Clostridia bacterium]